ncbi:hypothetical protein KH5H1_73410 [Corallococcus caeni]|nr:hypothetical protein KH5H1_73410 [Corallococcus sp. KH5-1]
MERWTPSLNDANSNDLDIFGSPIGLGSRAARFHAARKRKPVTGGPRLAKVRPAPG